MAKRYKLKSKWYRPESLRYDASDATRARHATAYLEWLATARGWFTEGRKCQRCHGTGETSWYGGGRHKSAPCTYCSGGWIGHALAPDVDKARGYCYSQEHELSQIAQAAVDRLRHRLFWHGLRPMVYGPARAPDIAAHDAREAERDRLSDAMNAAHAEADRIREEFEAQEAASGGTLYLEWLNSTAELPWRAAENEGFRLAREFHRLGFVDVGCWYQPGEPGLIHVGTRGARRAHDSIPPTASIVIKPGLAPSGAELDAMVAEALATMRPAEALPLAA